MKLNTKQIKHLRKLAHNFSPIVTVADTAINEALDIHELIKVKVRQPKPQRDETSAEICKKTGAVEIQKIGMVLLIFRPTKPSKITVPGLKTAA